MLDLSCNPLNLHVPPGHEFPVASLGLAALAPALASNTTLAHLDISMTAINFASPEWALVAASLAASRSLRHLLLGLNPGGGGPSFAQLLEKNRSLQSLSLMGIPLLPHHLADILETLGRVNRTLFDLDLCKISGTDALDEAAIALALRPNPIIREITFKRDLPQIQAVTDRNCDAQSAAIKAALFLITARKHAAHPLLSLVAKEVVLIIAKMIAASMFEPIWWNALEIDNKLS